MAMGRKVDGWFDEARGVWYARLGDISEATGKPNPVVLRDAEGQPITRGDRKGKDTAIRQILYERDRPRGPTVADVVRGYLAWHVAQESAPATIKTHYYHLKRFGDLMYAGVRYADRPAANIMVEDLWK